MMNLVENMLAPARRLVEATDRRETALLSARIDGDRPAGRRPHPASFAD
jgi:hypothetical protein